MPYKPPTSEPIAVVASSCRFTGGVTSPSKLWDLLKQPFDVSRTVPPSRFNVQAFFHQDGDYHGTTNAPNAYWLDDDQDVCAFDAGFFGIAPKEAEAVDPQQRLLLETVFEAIESAGYQLPQWAGKDVAVYVGAMTADFDTVSQRDDLSTSPYYATGNARSILSNRISYFYNFHGPSITIDTACSSSLVALHQAVLGLRAGDCSAACVAGVNVMLSPEQFLVESSLNMLSPTGHCHMWDSRADGYARGEGAAVLLLKPLSRALADGDGFRIQAIIRETGVGSDGRTAGITMPSPVAQASLICATYRRAGLDISDWDDRCQYFEAHGTGTPVGDPREAEAIYTAFFGKRNFDAKPDSTCTGTAPKMLVGSVKTVIGHTEGAAGLAGLLKVMLAMKHSKVAPNLHFERLNPQVAPYCTPTAQGFLHIPTQLVDWPPVASGQPLRASVNSFGFGGTNAHAIVERYDPVIHSPHYYFHRIDRLVAASTGVKSLPQIPLVLSAKSVSSLRILAKKYLDLFQLQENVGSESDYQEVAWLTHASKTLFLHRLAVCGQSRADAISILTDLLSDTPSQPKSFGCRAQHIEGRPDDNKPQVLGVFTGQGAQWAGMSRHLFLVNQVYRQSIRFLDSVLECCPDPPEWTLEEELLKLDADGSRLGEAAIAQPVSTALQIGLVNVLHQLGVHFTCVIGHSSGEIAAAYAAKSISARDAILIAYYRGKSTSTPSTAPARLEKDRLFGMLAVGMSFDNAHAFCEAFGSHLCVAASNSPSSSTLSGDMEAIQEAERQLKAKGIFCRRLRVDKAYHSQYMTDFSAWYSNALKSCHLSPLDRPVGCGQQTTWISSVGSDRRTPNTEQLAGSYWVDNMVRPVRFREATEEALQHGAFDCVVEVGPHFALKGPFLDTFAQFNTTRSLRAESLPYKSLLQRGKNDALSFLEFLGFALTQFDPALVDLHGILDDGGREQLAESLSRIQDADTETLPPYPWDHSQKFYRESRITRQFHHKQEPPHELLGSRTRDDAEGHELRWRNMLRVDKIPWLAHHAFQGQPLLPASAYCIMALDAAKSLLAGREASVIELQDVQFHRGVPLEIEGTATEIMFSLFVNHHPAGSLTEDQDKDLISCSFTLYFCSESLSTSLQKCCTGRVHIVLGSPSANALPRRVPPSRQPEVTRVSTDAFYDMMANVGLQYSGPFKSIESMHRRHNFATATLERIHKEDTSRLPWSPATLDSCLQTCFASYSSPGDGSLWTVFLPITIQRISFNMACGALSNITSSLQGTQLSVDAQLVRVRQATPDSPANITGDISIYNDTGDMEICVEGLTVGSLAPSDADTDRELYLYTRYAPDPEFALIQDGAIFDDTNVASGICERVLKESVERIKAFYKSTPEWASIWPAETEDSLNQHIFCSPYSFILEQVRACIKGSSDDHKGSVLALDELFPLHSLIEEGRHSFRFRRHTARIIKQIAHKYPRMSIFSLTDSTMGMSTEILRGLGSAFASYTSVVLGELEKDFDATLSHAPKTVRSRVSRVAFAQTGDIKTQLDSFSERAGQPYDLAILSTSIFKQATSGEAVLERLRFLMRPGGFLILINMPVRMARDLDQQPVLTCKSIFTPPDWPDLLDQHGFINPATKNTDQHYPGGFSITVRRNASQPTMPGQILPSPVSVPVPVGFNAEDRLLILGGRSSTVSLLAAHIGNLLSKHFKNLPVVISGLDEVAEVSTEHLPFFNNIILLSDLDESSPILSSLDEYRLGALRKLISRPESTILWVTEGSRTGNAESTASFGFTRSIRAEMPGLVLQMLDFDILKVAGDHAVAPCGSTSTSPALLIAQIFLQLMQAARKKREQSSDRTPHSNSNRGHADHLWVLENEIFIDCTGERAVSRLLPFKSGNDDYNSLRRVVTEQRNSLESCIKLVFDGARITYQAVPQPFPVSTMPNGIPLSITDTLEQVHVQVHYSSTVPFFYGLYVLIGRCIESGDIVLSASKLNSSFVSIPKGNMLPIGTSCAKFGIRACAALLLRSLLCDQIQRKFASKKVVLLIPEGLMTPGDKHLFQTQDSIFFVPILDDKCKACNSIAIHPRDTAAQIALKLAHFGEDATIVSFLPREHSVSRRLSGIMLWNPASHLWSDALEDTGRHTREIRHCHLEDLQQAWDDVQRLAASGHSFDLGADFVSVTGLLNLPGNISHSLKIVDWRVERLVGSKALSHGAFQNTVRENDEGQAIKLRADKTYVLIGITRDMGQSLSMLLIRQGAQHIVLASRTAVNSEPQWAKYARSIVGVHIQFEILDVTDLAAVKQFRARVEQRMPQIGGIVNGAMVLEDRVFAQMTAETFSRVMRPKTVGSRNLDTVFHDDEDQDDNKLDFFIMMSSFAAIGGHAGQCNYSAANMFMNGIAADRQRRGVAGFALNIGVVYGLGFLHREKEHLYTGLEREGYPPISERDLHHMFLEAIAHGRPKAYQSACNQPITELTAGLSRFNPKQAAEDALHWHKDPRFSHFTIEDNDSAGKSPIDGRTSSRTDRSNFKQLVDVINDDKSTAETISQHLVVALSDRLAALLHLSPATGSDGAGKSSKNCGSICKDSSMADLGVDSLVAVQVRTWLWRTTGRDVSVMKILIAPSIDIFCNEIAGKIAAERVKQTS